MERTLFNGLISGVALDGKTFFYPNPLESRGQHQRSPWFGVACCPANISRFLPSVPGYVYAQANDAIYVNLYVAGHRRHRARRQSQGPADAADALSVGRRGEDDRRARAGRARSRSTCAFPAGRARSRCRAISTGSSTRAAGDAEGQRRAGAADDRQGLRPDRARLEGRRRRSSSICRCRCAASSRTRRSPTTPAAWRCSAGRSSMPPSGPTMPAARVRNLVLPDAQPLTRSSGRRC